MPLVPLKTSTPDLVYTGRAGLARHSTRATGAGRKLAPRVWLVDEWTLVPMRPLPSALLWLLRARPPGGPWGWLLAMAQPASPPERARLAALGWPATWAARPCLAVPLAVSSEVHGIKVARHLARAAADGHLPLGPLSAADLDLWECCAQLLPRIVTVGDTSDQGDG